MDNPTDTQEMENEKESGDVNESEPVGADSKEAQQGGDQCTENCNSTDSNANIPETPVIDSGEHLHLESGSSPQLMSEVKAESEGSESSVELEIENVNQEKLEITEQKEEDSTGETLDNSKDSEISPVRTADSDEIGAEPEIESDCNQFQMGMLKEISEAIEGINQDMASLSSKLDELTGLANSRMMSQETCRHFDTTIKEQLEKIKLSLTRDILVELIRAYDDMSGIAKRNRDRFNEMQGEGDVVNHVESFEAFSKDLLKNMDDFSNALRYLLVDHGVEITTVQVGDEFDNKTQKNTGIIPTEDPEQNMRVASVFSDCYALEGKVIFPAQVKVYKLKK